MIATLRRRAEFAAGKAYARYSHFRVGAALLLEQPKADLITGCNVEISSYRLTTCAEQSVIAQAVALHGPLIRIRAVAIANLENAASSPCGACRQAIQEFSDERTWVFFPGEAGVLEDSAIFSLLPSAFRLG